MDEVEVLDGGGPGTDAGAIAPGARWREAGPTGAYTLEVVDAEPGRILVLRIADDDLPYGGTWEYRITPEEDGTATLTITERGEVYSPFFRFMARFVFGHEGTARTYLADLGARFGEDVELRTVEPERGTMGGR